MPEFLVWNKRSILFIIKSFYIGIHILVAASRKVNYQYIILTGFKFTQYGKCMRSFQGRYDAFQPGEFQGSIKGLLICNRIVLHPDGFMQI